MFHSSEGQKSEMRDGRVGSFWRLRENLFPAFLLAFLMATNNPWHSLSWRWLTPVSVRWNSPSLCMSVCLLIQTPVLRVRPHLCTLYLQRPYCQIRSHSQVLGGHEFWRTWFNSWQHYYHLNLSVRAENPFHKHHIVCDARTFKVLELFFCRLVSFPLDHLATCTHREDCKTLRPGHQNVQQQVATN